MIRACLLGWVFAAWGPLPNAEAPSHDRYVGAFDDAARLAQRGRHAHAARVLEDALPDFPQDYALVLQAAWMRFSAQHYRRAAAHYRRAIALSQDPAADAADGSVDSRLGLAWSLLYDGRKHQAVEQLGQLAVERPDDPEIARALHTARTRPIVAVHVWGSGTGYGYGNLPALRGGGGVQGGLSLRIAEHGLLGGSYGYARIVTNPDATISRAGPNGAPSGGGTQTMAGLGPAATQGADGGLNQHQVHIHAGASWPVAGGVAQYAYLAGDAIVSDLHVVGTSLRYSPWGDIVLETSVAFGDTGVVPRIAPSWRIPLAEHVWLRPLLALQVVDAEALAAGMLTAGVQGRRGALWIGGKYGRERNPAYLDIPVVFNLPGEIHWGAWAGGRVQLPAGFGLLAGYEVHALQVDTLATTTGTSAQAHYVTLGLDWRSR